MKKIFNVYNIALILVVALIGVLTLRTTEVKATGTVTWSGSLNSITLKRTIEHVIAAPIVTFGYTVTADSNNPTGASNVPTSASIAFAGSETVTSYSVEKTTSLSFASTTFTKPGDYTYTVEEDSTTNNTYPVDSTNTYTVIISVRNAVDANNIPTGNFDATLILEDSSSQKISGTSSNPPVAEFAGTSASASFSHIAISKTVKGNAADVNEYFAFTLTLSDSTNTYPISGIDSGATCTGVSTQPSSITGSTTFCLKHGQTAVIGQVSSGGSSFDTIPTNVTYNVKEANNSYTTIVKFGVDEYTYDTIKDSNITLTYNEVEFINTKTESALTGIILTILPYLLLVGIGTGGLILFKKKKEKRI